MTMPKTLLFLGAGFSRGLFGFPTQENFVDRFLDWNTREPWLSRFGRRPVPDSVVQALQSSQDVEGVLSDYHHKAFPERGRQVQPYTRDLIYLRNAIAAFFLTLEENEPSCTWTNNGRLLLEFLHREGICAEALTVATTNYDTGFERSWSEVHGDGSFGYGAVRLLGAASRKEVSTNRLQVLKVHGSANWLHLRGPIRQPGFPTNRDKTSIHLFTPESAPFVASHDNRGYVFRVNEDKASAAIIAFFRQKAEFFVQGNGEPPQLYPQIFAQFRESLARAERVIFLGYRLPQADSWMHEALTAHLADRQVRIDIVDLATETPLMTLLRKESFGACDVRIYRSTDVRRYLEGFPESQSACATV